MNPLRRSLLALLLVPFAAGHLVTAADPQAKPAEKAALIARDRVGLGLTGADLIIAGAKQRAAETGLRLNMAVVDDGGHMLAFARMDGARPGSIYTAMTKATAAATFRQPTGPLPPNGEPDVHLNLSLQNAAAASGGKVTTLKGGVPVIVDGQVIGAIGVGGGTGEQDTDVAKAGIQFFLDALGETKR